jgi:DNA invertase Pin-like site-specific DNA recombinase
VSLALRCAVYARFSSEKQSPLSIEDQVRKCREYAQPRGWSVLDSHVYSDEAISGATDDRFGLRRLLAAASSQEKPFDVVLCDDTSRISRSLKDSFTIHDELRFADIRLVFVSQGIDTDSEQAEVLLATHGIVDSLYIRELAKKTRRGVEGKALGGFHTGGRCFGY